MLKKHIAMPNIQPSILIWARETAQLTVEEAARKLGFRDTSKRSAAERLEAHETGGEQPSRATLLKMAKQYRRPLLTFYLARPPEIGDRGQDFRTLPEPLEGRQDVYVDQLVREVKACQATLRQALIDEEEGEPLSFVGKHTLKDGVTPVTQSLRDVLAMDIGVYRAQGTQEDAFRLLRRHVEAQRIFVLLRGNLGSWHTDISVKAFRGFALADEIAPFIVVNDLDSKSAWSFTLLHEMAHLLLGETGISNVYAERKIEKFCNDVASEYLLPEEDFGAFELYGDEFENYVTQIAEFAITHKVSSSHVSYRLLKRGDISRTGWEEFSRYFEDQWKNARVKQKEKSKEQDGGPSYYVVKRYKLGALANLVERFTRSGTLTTTKAGRMLGVKAIKVDQLFAQGHPA